MAEQVKQLSLKIGAGMDSDDEELALLTRRLREELLELDVESVDPVQSGSLPEGAKAGDAVVWGELLVALVASGGVLTTLIGLLQKWLARNKQNSVTLEIDGDKLEVTGVSDEQKQQLIATWINHHAKSAESDS